MIVISHTANQQRCAGKSLQVPSNIKRCATQYHLTIRKTVKQNFAKNNGPSLSHFYTRLGLGVRAFPIHRE
jgi:hypothetical protein